VNKVGWIIFSAAVVALIAGLVIWTKATNPATEIGDVNANTIIAANDQNGNIGDHTLGNIESKVVFTEYGDFQCPSCGGAHPQVKSLMEEYNEKIVFIFRNFPITQIHPNARAAAAAAESAGLQGKYWEMHDALFEGQNVWGTLDTNQRTEFFKGYAKELKLDEEKFATDLASANVGKKISFDQALGTKIGVNSTPAFFLNGTKVTGEAAENIVRGDATAMKKLIDEALAK